MPSNRASAGPTRSAVRAPNAAGHAHKAPSAHRAGAANACVGPRPKSRSICRPSVARAHLAGLFYARLNGLHGVVGQRFAELGQLLEFRLVLRAGVLKEFG